MAFYKETCIFHPRISSFIYLIHIGCMGYPLQPLSHIINLFHTPYYLDAAVPDLWSQSHTSLVVYASRLYRDCCRDRPGWADWRANYLVLLSPVIKRTNNNIKSKQAILFPIYILQGKPRLIPPPTCKTRVDLKTKWLLFHIKRKKREVFYGICG